MIDRQQQTHQVLRLQNVAKGTEPLTACRSTMMWLRIVVDPALVCPSQVYCANCSFINASYSICAQSPEAKPLYDRFFIQDARKKGSISCGICIRYRTAINVFTTGPAE